MQGATIRYLEYHVGPAMKLEEGARVYKIDNCRVTVRGNDTIQWIGLEVTPWGNFDLGLFLGEASLPAYGLTFGKFDEVTLNLGHYHSDCLGLCGNYKDPSVYDLYHGPHAQNDINIEIEVRQIGKTAVDAAYAWEHAMLKDHDEDWIMATKFNCEQTYDPLARELFKDVPITAIKVGYGLSANPCSDASIPE